MKNRNFEVVGIDGNLFNRLKHQAQKENISTDILIHRYLSFSLLYDYEVRKTYYNHMKGANFNEKTENHH